MKKFIIFLALLFVPVSTFASIDANLYYGIRNNSDVRELQEFLIDKGFLTGSATGNFLSLTLKAVKQYQISVGINSTGYVGNLTKKSINDELATNISSSNEAATSETGTIPPAPEPQKTNNDVVSALQAQIMLLQQQLSLLNKQTETTQQLQQTVQNQSQAITQIQQNTQQTAQNTQQIAQNTTPPVPVVIQPTSPTPTPTPTPAPTPTPIPSPIADISSNLVGHWKFDDAVGTTATDSSSNKNHGTLTGEPTWSEGKNGSALKFDGINDYVEIGDVTSLDVPDDITISLWFKTDTDQVGVLVNKFDNIDPDNGYYVAVSSRFNAGGTISTIFANNGQKDEFKTNSLFTDNKWHHLVVVFKSDTVTRTKIYIDGVEQNGGTSGSAISSIGKAVGYKFRIGRYSDDSYNFYFNGLIDDVRVYGRALSLLDIQELVK